MSTTPHQPEAVTAADDAAPPGSLAPLPPRTGRRTGGAAALTAGLTVYAGLMLVMMGVLQGLEGLAAVVHGDFFLSDSRYAYALPITAWGWGHLLLGVIAVAVGVGVLAGVGAARYVAIAVAFVAAVANFLFIPYYPLWAILLVALDLAVIWALAGDRRR